MDGFQIIVSLSVFANNLLAKVEIKVAYFFPHKLFINLQPLVTESFDCYFEMHHSWID